MPYHFTPSLFGMLMASQVILAQNMVSVYDEMRTDDFVVFHLDHPDHLNQLNRTRAQAGAPPLNRSEGLDWIAEQRGMRLAQLVINNMDEANRIYTPNCSPNMWALEDTELAHYDPHYDFMFMENFILVNGLVQPPQVGRELDESLNITLPELGSMFDINIQDYFANPSNRVQCLFTDSCDKSYFLSNLDESTSLRLNRARWYHKNRTDPEFTEVGFAYTTVIFVGPGQCGFGEYYEHPTERAFTFFYEVFN